MKKALLFFLCLIFVFVMSNSIYAVGLGIYTPYAIGGTDYDDFSTDSDHFGIGFVFDTNVAKRSFFSYRLHVGYESFSHTTEYQYYYFGYWYWRTIDYEGSRLVIDNTFSFGLMRTRVVRLWLGPMVRVGVVNTDEVLGDGFVAGAGITVLGLNFNMGPVFTLGLDAGYLFDVDIYDNDVGFNHMFQVKLSVIFRIADRYDYDW
ncbi:MAG: hypothetical protein P8Y99_13855 [Calditrichaceae bacterium]